MSRTTFSGPVASDNGFIGAFTGNVTGNVIGTVTGNVTGTVTGTIILPTATAADLGAVANAINTTGKVTGKTVVDIATGVIYTATGATAASAWKGSDATTVSPA